jgi:hypothetical protein
MKILSPRLAVIAMVLGSALSAHAVNLVDDFNVDQGPVTLYDTVTSGSGFTDLGGDLLRSISMSQLHNESVGDTRSRIAIKNGMLNFSNDAGVTSIGRMTYGYTSAKDFTGLTGFKVDFLSNDIASTIDAFVRDADGNASYYTVNIPGQTTGFSRTLSLVSGSADLSRITSINFAMGGVMDEDIRIDRVQSVPEPTSMAALGLGAVGMLRRRVAKK